MFVIKKLRLHSAIYRTSTQLNGLIVQIIAKMHIKIRMINKIYLQNLFANAIHKFIKSSYFAFYKSLKEHLQGTCNAFDKSIFQIIEIEDEFDTSYNIRKTSNL